MGACGVLPLGPPEVSLCPPVFIPLASSLRQGPCLIHSPVELNGEPCPPRVCSTDMVGEACAPSPSRVLPHSPYPGDVKLISPNPSRGILAARDAEGPQETMGPREARQVPLEVPVFLPQPHTAVPTGPSEVGGRTESRHPHQPHARSRQPDCPSASD